MAASRGSSNPKPPTRRPRTEATAIVPVVEERVVVDKHTRENGQVVVHVTPTQKRRSVNVPLMQQNVRVERIAINRQVDAPSASRQEGNVTIIPVYEEVLFMEKRLVLKEEIHITREQSVRNEQHEVQLRTEDVHVLRADRPAADA